MILSQNLFNKHKVSVVENIVSVFEPNFHNGPNMI